MAVARELIERAAHSAPAAAPAENTGPADVPVEGAP
jgi:hypothetical protein